MSDDTNPYTRPSDAPGAKEESSGGTSDRELIVVSNRQPYRHTYDPDGGGIVVDRPTGGLTAGLDPVLRRMGGTWIAWGDGEADRDVVDEDDRVAVPPDDPGYALERVWLSDEQVRDYYSGFANQVLWPICHAALGNVRCEASFWERYREVNEQFATATVRATDADSIVWLQDYHFALAPRLVRQELPDGAVLAHFWHIPWPGWDTFRACPHGEALLDGLLGNDLLGFHVPRYGENFVECVDAALDGARVDREASRVRYRGTDTQIVTAPMGVDVEEIDRRATDPDADAFRSTFRETYGIPDDARIALGVDRLDYSKGLPERLRALERLWEERPDLRERLTFVQSASESRTSIPAYQDLRETVVDRVERLNDRFGTDGWQPVVFTTKWFSPTELAGLYRLADVAIVSPIRDGMNLVAQEFVAAQVDRDGVLVLSDQTGAHESLRDGALSVPPFDPSSFATAIAEALDMPTAERRGRMALLREQVRSHDISTWAETLIEAAEEQASGNRESVAA